MWLEASFDGKKWYPIEGIWGMNDFVAEVNSKIVERWEVKIRRRPAPEEKE